LVWDLLLSLPYSSISRSLLTPSTPKQSNKEAVLNLLPFSLYSSSTGGVGEGSLSWSSSRFLTPYLVHFPDVDLGLLSSAWCCLPSQSGWPLHWPPPLQPPAVGRGPAFRCSLVGNLVRLIELY
jgi:hypothetical protein